LPFLTMCFFMAELDQMERYEKAKNQPSALKMQQLWTCQLSLSATDDRMH